MEIQKKPYKKKVNARKYAGAKWPHQRASIAMKQAITKKEFDKKEYHKKRYEELKKWKQGWFSND